MAAGTWKVFNTFKSRMGLATCALSGEFRLALAQSASNLKTSASALARGIYGSITSEVANGNGYVTLGYQLTSENWNQVSASKYKFSVASLTFTATGGTIPNIKYAYVYASNATSTSRFLVCYVTLTTSQFTLAQNNTCTINTPANGLFTLS
jgi:hypothetical protein